jgi:putative ABC transport system substrate-binding protein
MTASDTCTTRRITDRKAGGHRHMRRRVVFAGIAAAVLPVAARSQAIAQGAVPNALHPRRIAVLMAVREGDPEGDRRYGALRAGLRELGWIDGDTAKLEVYWAGGDLERIHALVGPIVASVPDIIVGNGTAAASELRMATKTIPVVFVLATDPVGLGLIETLARPGGNLTGFSFFDPPLVGKWFELLQQMAPGVARTSLIFNPGTAAFYYKFFEGLPGLGTIVRLAPVHDLAEVETTLAGLANEPGASVIVGADPFNVVNIARIVALIERFRLTAISVYRQFAVDGGLMAYGPDTLDAFHSTANYVDRVLRGARPADLPAQAPTKYQFILNLKTAKKLGLTVPPVLLARADEVIE